MARRHSKPAATDGTATAGGQPSGDTDITVGATHGRSYDKGLNAPSFIAPPSDPLRALMELQGKLGDEIRQLVNLSVASLASKSAESKAMDNQGLEAGLSFIGLVLENAERQVAEHWAAYEERNVVNRQIATIKYPDVYNLRTDADRIDEAQNLGQADDDHSCRKINRESAKCIVLALLGGKISVDDLESINKEIDAAPYTTSDWNTIIQSVINGICGEKRPPLPWASTTTNICKPGKTTPSVRFACFRPRSRSPEGSASKASRIWPGPTRPHGAP